MIYWSGLCKSLQVLDLWYSGKTWEDISDYTTVISIMVHSHHGGANAGDNLRVNFKHFYDDGHVPWGRASGWPTGRKGRSSVPPWGTRLPGATRTLRRSLLISEWNLPNRFEKNCYRGGLGGVTSDMIELLEVRLGIRPPGLAQCFCIGRGMVTPFGLETLVRLLTKWDCLACLETKS